VISRPETRTQELLFQGDFVSPDLHGIRAGLSGVAGDEVSSKNVLLTLKAPNLKL